MDPGESAQIKRQHNEMIGSIRTLITSLEKNSAETANLTKWLIGVTIAYTIITAAGVIIAAFK